MEREICLEYHLGTGLEFQHDCGSCFHGVYDLGEEKKNKWMRLHTTGKSYGNKVQDAAEGLNGQDSGPIWRARGVAHLRGS